MIRKSLFQRKPPTFRRKKHTINRILVIYIIISLCLTFTPIFDIPIVRSASTYYVATDGDDTGVGSIGDPFATIQRALNASGDGDTVYVRGGNYNHIWSKTVGLRIKHDNFLLSGYQDEVAVINGDGYSISSSYGLINIGTCSASYNSDTVTIQNLVIENSSSDGIKIHSCGTGRSDNVTIDNVTFNNISLRGFIAWSGRTLTHSINNTEVKNCWFNNTQAKRPLSMGEGVTFYGCQNVSFHDNLLTNCPKIMLDFANQTKNVVCYNNTFVTTRGTAIKCDGSQSTKAADPAYVSNVSIYNNLFYGTYRAIYIHGEKYGGCHNISIYNNIINVTNASEALFAIKLAYSSAYGSTLDNISITYNTIYVRDGTAGACLTMEIPPHLATNITVANNIFQTAGDIDYQIHSTKLNSTESCLNFHNNTYNHTLKSPNTYWYGGTLYQFESSFINASPEFVDRATYDFHLNTSSPCVNKATINYTVATDFDGSVRPQGNGYDIGALEYIFSLPGWLLGWDKNIRCTIESDYIQRTLTDFPVMVVINSTISAYCEPYGEDIRFIDEANATEYYYEIEEWNTSGDSIVWVNIPTISSSADTQFYFYFGNANAIDNQSKNDVWNSDYVAVYHMNDSTSSTITDSTVNNYKGTKGTGAGNEPDEKTGAIGKAQYFDESDNINLGSGVQWDIDTGTFEFWMNSDREDKDHVMLSRYDDSDNYMMYGFPSDDIIWFDLKQSAAHHSVQFDITSTNLSSGVWGYTTATFNGQMNLTIDSRINDTLAENNGLSYLTGSILYMGEQGGGIRYRGFLDEVRISDVVRNNSWINATYHNQNKSYHLNDFLHMSAYGDYAGNITITGHYPETGAIWVELLPRLNVSITNALGDAMTIRWFSNSSGSWELFGKNTSVANGTYDYINTNFSQNTNTYFWNVSINDNGVKRQSPIYHFKTPHLPQNPTSVASTFFDSLLDVTWVKGDYADRTIIVRNNNSNPDSPSDGTEIYNDTGVLLDDYSVSGQAFFRIYSYNTTGNVYSSGVRVPWGELQINCYTENKSDALTFDIFIHNYNQTETYYKNNCSNTLQINSSDLPTGNRVIIRISANVSHTTYDSRWYHLDIRSDYFYIINAYLPPSNETDVFAVHVVGERQGEYEDPPVADAFVLIKKFIGGSFVNMTSVFTNAGGNAYFSLMLNDTYQLEISKAGYETTYADFDAIEDVLVQEFLLRYENQTGPNYTNFWDTVTFTGEMHSNQTLEITYDDSLTSTTNTQMYVYRVYNNTITLNASDSRTSTDSYVFWVAGINISRIYYVDLFVNSSLDYGIHFPVSITIQPLNITEVLRTVNLEQRFISLFGTNPLGWGNVISIVLALIVLTSFGIANTGAGIIGSGISLAGMQIVFVANGTPFNPALVFSIPVVIFIGIAYVWATNKGDDIL